MYWQALPSLSQPTLALSALTLIILIFLPRLTKKIPAPIAAHGAATAAASLLKLPVETIGSRFGALPQGLPRLQWPGLDFRQMSQLVRPATTVALLAGIESLLSAVVADGMIGGRHRSGMELVAQGAANIGSSLFGGIPVTGAIARTATNVKSGGRTPVAGITHAIFLALVLVLFGRWVSHIPLCALTAILVVVSYHMSEWRSFFSLLRSPRSDIAVLLTTFFLTVLVDLTVAVEVGMVLAAFLFMRRMAEITRVGAVRRELSEAGENSGSEPGKAPPGVEIYEINGPFFFGAADKLGEVLSQIQNPPKAFILRMRHVPTMDATGLHALEEFYKRCKRQGTRVLFTEIHSTPFCLLKQAGKIAEFGKENFKADFPEALEAAKKTAAG